MVALWTSKKTTRFQFPYTLSFALLACYLLLPIPVTASSTAVTLAWDANTESDLAGYRIYYKTYFSGPPYDGMGAIEGDSPITLTLENLDDPYNPEYTIQGLSDAETYFYAVTAYNIEEYESGYSNEVYNLCSHIDPPTVDAAFSALTTSGYEPLTVDFSDESFGAIEFWTWDFGDGGKKSEQNPLNTYHQAGNYTVRLIVSGPDGCDIETVIDYITVKPKAAVVDTMETGAYETTGKGKNRITSFVLKDIYSAGDEVVVLAQIVDHSGSPLENATVEITIGGPETDFLSSSPSNGDGIAEVIWETSPPKRKGGKGKGGDSSGTTPGIYNATINKVVATGYIWDSMETSTTFEIK